MSVECKNITIFNVSIQITQVYAKNKKNPPLLPSEFNDNYH